MDTYLLPLMQDIFASLANGKSFTKLDLAHAYQQLILDDDSRLYTTINTHRGLFPFNPTTLWLSAAPAINQRMMESLLSGLPHVCIYVNDILVTGESDNSPKEPGSRPRVVGVRWGSAETREVFLHDSRSQVSGTLHFSQGNTARQCKTPSYPRCSETSRHLTASFVPRNVELLRGNFSQTWLLCSDLSTTYSSQQRCGPGAIPRNTPSVRPRSYCRLHLSSHTTTPRNHWCCHVTPLPME